MNYTEQENWTETLLSKVCIATDESACPLFLFVSQNQEEEFHKELEQIVRLSTLKLQLHDFHAPACIDKVHHDKNLPHTLKRLNFCLTGNPGTRKAPTAKIIDRMYFYLLYMYEHQWNKK